MLIPMKYLLYFDVSAELFENRAELWTSLDVYYHYVSSLASNDHDSDMISDRLI